jgi:hypothetical protein
MARSDLAYTRGHKAYTDCHNATKRSDLAYTRGHMAHTHCHNATKRSDLAYTRGHMAYTHCHKAAMHCELATKRSQPAYTHCHKPTTHCELATKESQRAYPPGHKARMHCDNATKHCWSASTNYDRPNKESRRADTLDGLSVALVTSAPGNSGPRGRKSRRGAAVREPVAAKKPGSQAQIQRLKQYCVQPRLEKNANTG